MSEQCDCAALAQDGRLCEEHKRKAREPKPLKELLANMGKSLSGPPSEAR